MTTVVLETIATRRPAPVLNLLLSIVAVHLNKLLNRCDEVEPRS